MVKDKKQYYADNRIRIIEYSKQYKIKNRELIKEKNRQYCIKNKKDISEKARQRRLNNIEEYKKRDKRKNPITSKRCRLKRDFGISLEEYNEKYYKQNGICVICNNKSDSLCVDHDHKTGRIRSLLCHQCNLMLGNAKENIKTLENAIVYINNYSD